MNTILFCFLITAVLGAYLFLPVFKQRKAPKLAVYFHGIFAVTSVALLTSSYLTEGSVNPITMVLFLLAALNGIYMFFVTEIQKRTVPPSLLLLHGNLAVIAFISLIYFLYFA